MKILFSAICMVLFSAVCAQQPRLVLPEGHLCGDRELIYNPVSCAISPDERWIATARGSELRIWELQSGNLVQTFRSFVNGVSAICFTGDNRHILVAGLDIDKPNKHGVRICNIYTGEQIDIPDHTGIKYISDIVLSADKKKALITGDSLVLVYDLLTNSLERTVTVNYASASFPISGGRFITMGSQTRIWSLENEEGYELFNTIPQSGHANQMIGENCYLVQSGGGVEIRSLTDNRSVNSYFFGRTLNKAAISADGRYLLAKTYRDSLYLMDFKKGKVIFTDTGILDMQVQPDGRAFLYKKSGMPPQIRRFSDLKNPIAVFPMEDRRYAHSYSAYLRGTTYMYTCRTDDFDNLSVDVIDTRNMQRICTLEGHALTVEYATMNKSGSKLFTSSTSSFNHVFDLKTGRLIGRFIPTTSAEIDDLLLQGEVVNNRWVQYYADHWEKPGSTKCAILMDTTNKAVCTFYPLDSADYVTLLPDGYYQCTPHAARLLHYVTPDLRVITFEQLDVKYNRPDRILRALGNNDSLLIQGYYRAWQKRIAKLGVDTLAFRDGYTIPTAEILNREALAFEQKSEKINLRILLRDSISELNRFNIWVNEIPIFGQRGCKLPKRGLHRLDTTLQVSLSPGENRIELSVMNSTGTESYRMPLSLNYTPAVNTREKVYFIGIGVQKFANPQHNLNYSSKDIRDLTAGLKNRYGNSLEIDTLFNENFTINNLIKLKKKLMQTGISDKVIIAYSGHGLLSKDYDYYLSTYNVDFDHPEVNGLPYETLEGLLDSIPARQKLLLLDACHSGEVDKEEAMHIARVADSLGLTKGARYTTSADTNPGRLGLSNSFELMQNLFVNVSKGTGAYIISASAGTQFALERGDLRNGVFTYAILEAMKNQPKMTVTQLNRLVSKRVTELTGGLQKPTSRGETLYHDWRVW